MSPDRWRVPPQTRDLIFIWLIIFTFPIGGWQTVEVQAQTPFSSLQAPGYREVKLDNGSVISINHYKGMKWVGAGGKDIKYTRAKGASLRHLALFPGKNAKNSFFSLAQVSDRNTGLALHRFDGPDKEPELLIRIHERLRASELSFLQLENGNIIVVSNQGLLMCLRDAKTVDRLALDGYYQDPNKMFQQIHFVAGVNNRVLFFSNVSPQFEGKALRRMIVYDSGEFAELDEEPLVGPFKVLDEKLVSLSQTGFKRLDLATFKISERPILAPIVDGVALEPCNFFETKQGELISTWQKPFRERRTKQQMFQNGFYSLLANLRGDEWELSSVGLDSKDVVWKTQFAEDPKGRCWFSGSRNQRIVVRDTDGRFEPVAGINTLRDFVNRFEFENGVVRVFHNPTHFDEFVIDELLGSSEAQGARWVKLRTRTPIVLDGLGNGVAILADEVGKILRVNSQGVSKIEMPQDPLIRQPGNSYVTADTRGNIWLFSDRVDRASVYEDGQWTIYKSGLNEGSNKTARHLALEAQLDKLTRNEPFQIDPNNQRGNRIVFGPDRQIVYRSSYRKLVYFDGERWHDPGKQSKEPKYVMGNPFFHGDKVCFRETHHDCYGMNRSGFQSMKRSTDVRPWQKIEYESTAEYRSLVKRNSWSPPEPPFGKSRKHTGGWTSQAKNRLAVSIDRGPWSVLDLQQTPMEDNRYVVLETTGDGFLAFKSNSIRYVYHVPQLVVTSKNRQLGDVAKPWARLPIQFDVEPDDVVLKAKYRIGNDPWSNWVDPKKGVILRGLANQGEYSLEVKFGAVNEITSTPVLKYRFTTSYSLNLQINDLITQLDDQSFEAREDATKKLIRIGPACIDVLESVPGHSSVEVKMRTRKILDVIRKNFADYLDSAESSERE